MSQAKVKAKTLQQKMGFVDTDLRTPQHDAIMVWLDQEVGNILRNRYLTEWPLNVVERTKETMWHHVNNMKRILQEELDEKKKLPDIPAEWLKKAKLEDSEYRQKRIDALGVIEQWSPGEPPLPVAMVTQKIWEYPITGKNDYVVGFIDMKVTVSYDYELSFAYDSHKNPSLPEWDKLFRSDTFFFEVKPTIQSIGELIRQIRLYQQYKQGKYIVVSPDDRFASIIKGQGIEFLKVDA